MQTKLFSPPCKLDGSGLGGRRGEGRGVTRTSGEGVEGLVLEVE